MKKQILLMMAGCFLWLLNYSQNGSSVILTGKIVDEKTQALGGASVRVKGTSSGVIADQNGKFRVTVASLPATLLVSHTNFQEQEIVAENTNEISIYLTQVPVFMREVVLKAKGMPARLRDVPVPLEYMGPGSILQLPTTSVSDALVYKKGVDLTSSSLTFKTPSTRGFNGSGSTRVNQIVDGMDNQAPGLNFFVGNFTGLTELDIESVELLPGASSALYGPGGMNGTILMNSKSPFDKKYQGLSVIVKPGIMHLGSKSPRENSSLYNDYSFRWAKSFKDKFAFKVGAQYISADDWLASDTSNYLRAGTSGKLIPGSRASDPNYDGVNVYGDETSLNIYDIAQLMVAGGYLPANALPLVPDMNVSRTGYQEKDIIDPQTKNLKLSGALHYKINDKIEAQLMA